MAIGKLIRFFSEAIKFARPDDGPQSHRRYHRRVVWISGLSGMVFGVVGTVLLLGEKPADPREARLLYMAPFLFGAWGILFGMSLAFVFAPREFLLGPVGSKWMAFIGTTNPATARFICAAVSAVLGGIPLLLACASASTR